MGTHRQTQPMPASTGPSPDKAQRAPPGSPILGAQAAFTAVPRGTLSPCSHQEATQCWGRIQLFSPPAGTRLQWLTLSQPTRHWLASAGGQCWGTNLVHPSEHHWSPEQASRAGGGSCSAPEHRVSICHPIAPVQAGPTGARISAGTQVGRKEVRTQDHGVISFSLNIRATLTQQRKGGQGPQPAAPFGGTWPWPGAPASHCQDEQTRQQHTGSREAASCCQLGQGWALAQQSCLAAMCATMGSSSAGILWGTFFPHRQHQPQAAPGQH